MGDSSPKPPDERGTIDREENQESMRRKWERERNYWLDHFGQYHPGSQRLSPDTPLTSADYVAIPLPLDTALPLQPPCLIWRWMLRGGGYGTLNGRGVHVIAFEQSRGREIREERQINHLCNRPFCLQPAHLYEGTALQNSADRKAELARGRYTDWRTMVERFDDALTQHHWPAPEPAGIAAGWGEPLECPHATMPEMFEKKGRGGNVTICANCSEVRQVREGRPWRGWKPCGMEQPCRCPTDPRHPATEAQMAETGAMKTGAMKTGAMKTHQSSRR